MDKTIKKRVLALIRTYAVVIAVLLAYAAFAHFTGIAIPCVFRLITKLRCPGCGISRFCLGMLSFRFREAISYNYASPFICAYAVWIIADTSVRYVKTGYVSLNPKPAWINYIFLAGLIIWGVVRNITGL
ncbi:MAG: DUF2752 domain-containing protein [Butyrivibrio sp.]